MNSGTEMYKKKYLKYKMKYLSLQQKGGSAIKEWFTTSKLNDDEIDKICVYHGKKINCNNKYKDTKCPRTHLGINVKNRKECVEKLILGERELALSNINDQLIFNSNFNNDKEIVLAIVKKNGLYIKHASENLQKDPDIQNAAFENNMFALEGIINKNKYIRTANGYLAPDSFTFHKIIYENGDEYIGEIDIKDVKKKIIQKFGRGKMKYKDGSIYIGSWGQDQISTGIKYTNKNILEVQNKFGNLATEYVYIDPTYFSYGESIDNVDQQKSILEYSKSLELKIDYFIEIYL